MIFSPATQQLKLLDHYPIFADSLTDSIPPERLLGSSDGETISPILLI